ncbi:hypothetical protein FGIG_10897 [Fasciola gigantica]|uniref:Transmembrane protein 59 n=1 Tax=Fasciola gigantica TaxID=46835 RepID=A0A504YK90_FASGI|nr:hypothetical protein FGIG_10897 [Fasciola gigantica]
MFRCGIIACVIICLVGATSTPSVDSLESCSLLCEKKYDLLSEDACIGGCKKGEAKGVNQNSSDGCNDWCSSSHIDNKELTEACVYGCNSYAPKEKSNSWIGSFSRIFDVMRNFYRGAMRRLGMPCAQDSTPAPSTEIPSTSGFIIVRRFHISWPFGRGDEPRPHMMHDSPMHRAVMDNNGVAPMEMMGNPIERMMHFGEDSANLNNNEPQVPPLMPQMIAVRIQEPSLTDQIGYGLRFLGSHPFALLCSITLVALCVLFVVLLIVECRRRHNRANQFQYNQFDHLPTYVEATMIKVPTDGDFFNETMEKPLKA